MLRTDRRDITSPMSDLVFHSALSARRAAFSNVGSPVSRLSVANSRMKVPTPAVQVTGVSVGLTPCSRLTVPYGMPLGVWNADHSYTTSYTTSYSSQCNTKSSRRPLLAMEHITARNTNTGKQESAERVNKVSPDQDPALCVCVCVPGSSFLAASSAILSSGPVQGQPGSRSKPALPANRWADSSPPTTENTHTHTDLQIIPPIKRM